MADDINASKNLPSEKEIKSKMGNMMNMPGGPKLPF